MSPLVRESLTAALAIASVLLNVYLVLYSGQLTSGDDQAEAIQCTKVLSKTNADLPWTAEQLAKNVDLDALPSFKGRLTHVVIELNPKASEVESLQLLFQYWKKYPPCLLASYPNNWTSSQVTLTMLFTSTPDVYFLRAVRRLFRELPTPVRLCFKNLELRQAGLSPPHNETIEALDANARHLFSKFLKNEIDLVEPNHVLYLNTECVPVQANWLNLIDYKTRPSMDPYWMLGSVFRGQRDRWTINFPSFLHISRHAIYNVADGSLSRFYHDQVQPYVQRIPRPKYSFGRWEMDIFHYLADLTNDFNYTRFTHKFRLGNVILNMWNSTFDVDKLHEREPDVAIVCGIPSNLTIRSFYGREALKS